MSSVFHLNPRSPDDRWMKLFGWMLGGLLGAMIGSLAELPGGLGETFAGRGFQFIAAVLVLLGLFPKVSVPMLGPVMRVAGLLASINLTNMAQPELPIGARLATVSMLMVVIEVVLGIAKHLVGDDGHAAGLSFKPSTLLLFLRRQIDDWNNPRLFDSVEAQADLVASWQEIHGRAGLAKAEHAIWFVLRGNVVDGYYRIPNTLSALERNCLEDAVPIMYRGTHLQIHRSYRGVLRGLQRRIGRERGRRVRVVKMGGVS